MEQGKHLSANIFSGVVAFIGLVLISVYGPTIIGKAAAILLGAILFWRFAIFPSTGWALIKAATIWSAFCTAAGMLLAFFAVLLIEHGARRPGGGLGAVLYGPAFWIGILAGIVVGTVDYHRVRENKASLISATTACTISVIYATVLGSLILAVGALYRQADMKYWGIILLLSTIFALGIKKFGRAIMLTTMLALVGYSAIFVIPKTPETIIVAIYFIIPELIIAAILLWEMLSEVPEY